MPVTCYTKDGNKIEPKDVRIPIAIQIEFMEMRYGGKWEVKDNETKPNRQTLEVQQRH